MSDSTPAPPRPTPTSAGEAAKAVTDDVQRLVKAEVALAKAEVQAQVAAKGLAIGLLAFAGLLGLYVLYWLTYAAFRLFRPQFTDGRAALLTALVLAGVALLFAAVGGLILRRPMAKPERAQAAAESTQALLKEKLGRQS